MTNAAASFVGLRQAGITDLVGIDHDFRRPIVGTSAMTGLALHSRKSGRPGGVTPKATRRALFRTETIGGPGVRRRAPAHIGGPVTELAALRSNEGGFVSAQAQEGDQQDEATSCEGIRHPFLHNRLARPSPGRQGVEPPRTSREGTN